MDARPHVLKVRYFEGVFPFAVKSVEWVVRWPMHMDGRRCTYNPDYWCEALGRFIECCTSLPNYNENGAKWRMAMKLGYPLRVFWWTGIEITEEVRNQEPINAVTGSEARQ